MLQKKSVILLMVKTEKEPTLYTTSIQEGTACLTGLSCFKSDNIQEYRNSQRSITLLMAVPGPTTIPALFAETKQSRADCSLDIECDSSVPVFLFFLVFSLCDGCI